MKPEQMEGMMKMAAEMKDMGMDPGAGGGGAPSADMMSKMAEKMKDPAMQSAMSDMMKVRFLLLPIQKKTKKTRVFFSP